jgi:acetyl-CoA carboxylase biotin carboxyl carrier protein
LSEPLMNLDDIRQILELVREHDLAEFEIERDGLKVRIRKAGHEVTVVAPSAPIAAPQAAPATAGGAGAPAAAPPGPEPADAVDLAIINSPIVGTFYRTPEPGAANFVEVGDRVRKGQVLCIIEAMKLMNEIECDTEGEITAVYVENGRPVQFGERLFAIRVAGR